MDDERLLSEALRAHAAGGVSTPSPAGPDPAGGDDDGTQPASDGASRVGGRFRPLGRARRAEPPARPAPPMSAPRATPTSGTPVPARPLPPPPTPAAGSRPLAAPMTPPPAPAPVAESSEWTAGRVAWWSAVAVLGGGVLGSLVAVISLAAPG